MAMPFAPRIGGKRGLADIRFLRCLPALRRCFGTKYRIIYLRFGRTEWCELRRIVARPLTDL